jgi:hypothetical protein
VKHSTPHELLKQANHWCAYPFFAGLIVLVALAGTFFCPLPVRPVILCVAALLYMVVALVALLQTLRLGPPRAPRWLEIVGVLATWSGSAADITATYLASPDLAREANPLASLGLAAGYAPWQVLLCMGLVQTGIFAVTAVSWIWFVRWGPVLLRTLWRDEPRTFGEFLRGALGGGKLTWAQFLTTFRPRQFEQPYIRGFQFPLALPHAVIGLVRWLPALIWWQVVPHLAPSLVWATTTVAAVLAYVLWLLVSWSAGVGRSDHDS